LSTVNTAIFYFFPPSTPSSYIRHCKNTLSLLHIFVHYCTFCASLHVITSPDAYILLLCEYETLEESNLFL